nr:acyl-CoA dehydrogenase family protein [Mesorhizobium sp.]
MSLTSEERALLGETARNWFRDHAESASDRPVGLPARPDAAALRQLGALGLIGIAVPEAIGGSGGDIDDLCVFLEAAGEKIDVAPLLSTLGSALPLLIELGASNQLEDLLPPLLSGQHGATLFHFEPGLGFGHRGEAATAVPTGDGYRLNGVKLAPLADPDGFILATATIADGNLAVFVVSPATKGVSIEPYRTIDGRTAAVLRLSDAEISSSARLFAIADARPAVESALDFGALCAMAEAIGVMATLVDDTAAYLKTRQQFGVTLSQFQVLQHRCVDMLLALEDARAVVTRAAEAFYADAETRSRLVSVAKAVAGRAALFVGRQAVQLHGGMGMTDELRIGHGFKRLTVLEAYYGTAESHIDRLAARFRGVASG